MFFVVDLEIVVSMMFGRCVHYMFKKRTDTAGVGTPFFSLSRLGGP